MEPGLHGVCDAMMLGIFTNLGPATLLNGRKTCRRWRNVIWDWSLWRNLVLPGKSGVCLTEEQTEEVGIVADTEVRSLTIPSGYLDMSVGPTTQVLRLLSGDIKSLAVDYCGPVRQQSVGDLYYTGCPPNVERLLISAPSCLEILTIMLPIMHHVPRYRPFLEAKHSEL